MKLAVDAMGGDFAPAAAIDGALNALKETDPSLEIVLVGDPDQIRNHLNGPPPTRVQIHPTTQVVTMHDQGSKVVKTKPDSSIVQGIKLIKDGVVDGFVSAGHTGAVMTTALLLLGRIENVKRPALGVYISTSGGGKILCDVGANPDAKAGHLLQFAIMAALYLDHVEGIKNPQIGLVNIGGESNKGSDLYVEAHQLLKREMPNFIGNIEGRHILDTTADVIVCDGFVGNTVLKFAEGWVSIFSHRVREIINQKLSYRLGAVLLKPVFEAIKKEYDYEETGGTPLLGVNGVTVISHGNASSRAIKNSVLVARKCIQKNLIEDIRQGLRNHLGATP